MTWRMEPPDEWDENERFELEAEAAEEADYIREQNALYEQWMSEEPAQ